MDAEKFTMTKMDLLALISPNLVSTAIQASLAQGGC